MAPTLSYTPKMFPQTLLQIALKAQYQCSDHFVITTVLMCQQFVSPRTLTENDRLAQRPPTLSIWPDINYHNEESCPPRIIPSFKSVLSSGFLTPTSDGIRENYRNDTMNALFPVPREPYARARNETLGICIVGWQKEISNLFRSEGKKLLFSGIYFIHSLYFQCPPETEVPQEILVFSILNTLHQHKNKIRTTYWPWQQLSLGSQQQNKDNELTSFSDPFIFSRYAGSVAWKDAWW